MNRNDGKTRSVNVHPLQAEWRSSKYAERSAPLLFTRIMNAITMPRMTSSETILSCLTAGRCMVVAILFSYAVIRLRDIRASSRGSEVHLERKLDESRIVIVIERGDGAEA